jgi:hypothetical protein
MGLFQGFSQFLCVSATGVSTVPYTAVYRIVITHAMAAMKVVFQDHKRVYHLWLKTDTQFIAHGQLRIICMCPDLVQNAQPSSRGFGRANRTAVDGRTAVLYGYGTQLYCYEGCWQVRLGGGCGPGPLRSGRRFQHLGLHLPFVAFRRWFLKVFLVRERVFREFYMSTIQAQTTTFVGGGFAAAAEVVVARKGSLPATNVKIKKRRPLC